MFARLFSYFRKPVEAQLEAPSLATAYKTMKTMTEQYDDLLFYIPQIKDIDLREHPELCRFLEKAEYNMLSVRDELKIHLDRLEKLNQLDLINLRNARRSRHVG